MEIVDINNTSAKSKMLEVLRKGGIVIYPTETCYGVGVDATNQLAVDNVLKYKRRPEGKALSVAVNGRDMANEYVVINIQAEKIYKSLLPGPITVISKSRQKLAHGLASEHNTQGIRYPKYDWLLEVIKEFGKPITSTSANSSGKKTPYNIDDILTNLSKKQKDMIDLIIDAGELPHNPPSVVVDTTQDDMQILRKGSVRLTKPLVDVVVRDAEQMSEEGAKLIANKRDAAFCTLLLFNADLGAGKTHFVKGVARQLGVTEIVKSPTYSIFEEYDISGGAKLIHIDAWRLQSTTEFESLNLTSYIAPGNVIAIEWAGSTAEYFEQLNKLQNTKTFEISIDYVDLKTRVLKIYE